MRTMLAWLLILSLACTGMASAQQVVRSFRVDVALDIDGQGRVAQATPPDDLLPALREPVRKGVMQWRFKPVTKDGVAVAARTYGRLKVDVIEQSPGKYGLHLAYLSNGPSLMFMRAPRFPSEMMKASTEADLNMDAVVQPDGSLADIRMADVKIHGGSGPQRAAKVFERAAREAMASMQAKPEWIDGKPVSTRISVPFAFRLNGDAGGGEASGSAIGAATSTAN